MWGVNVKRCFIIQTNNLDFNLLVFSSYITQCIRKAIALNYN